jgi:ribosomal protein S27E
MATFRKSTLVIVAVQSADYENERCPSLEAEQADRPETEQKVLSQQAALQEMPRCGASGAQGRAQRHSGQAADEGVQAGPKLLIVRRIQAYRGATRQASAKVADMSAYEVLTIALIAVIGTAATAAIYLGLLNWMGAFYVVRCAGCHHLAFSKAKSAQASCPHCRHPVLTHPLYSLHHRSTVSEVRVVGDRLHY